MTLHRFFLDTALSGTPECGVELVLSEHDRHHLARVLRLVPGDRIIVVDTEGRQSECTLVEVSPDHVIADIDEAVVRPRRPRVVLAPAISRRERMELTVQKVDRGRRRRDLAARDRALRRAPGRRARRQAGRALAADRRGSRQAVAARHRARRSRADDDRRARRGGGALRRRARRPGRRRPPAASGSDRRSTQRARRPTRACSSSSGPKAGSKRARSPLSKPPVAWSSPWVTPSCAPRRRRSWPPRSPCTSSGRSAAVSARAARVRGPHARVQSEPRGERDADRAAPRPRGPRWSRTRPPPMSSS